MDSMTDLTERLRKLLADATPGDLSTAERHTENETVECPLCHEGEVEASDYCNIDGKALGVQFYGIGKEFGAHERLWSETLAALPNLLTTLETLTQENARLREALEQHSLAALIGMINSVGGKITVRPKDVENAVNQEVVAYYDPTNDTKVYRVRARKALGGGDDAN